MNEEISTPVFHYFFTIFHYHYFFSSLRSSGRLVVLSHLLLCSSSFSKICFKEERLFVILKKNYASEVKIVEIKKLALKLKNSWRKDFLLGLIKGKHHMSIKIVK